MSSLSNTIKRRWRRQARRRAVGRAYDMALEIMQLLPMGSSVLDVGCGNGFIAHHLQCLLGTAVTGIDVGDSTDAFISYSSFDGRHFPVADKTFDAVLLCYVLHHAQSFELLISEIQRVLKFAGLVIVYEDIPDGLLSRLVCGVHNRKWKRRTGPCNFQLADQWRETFTASGFSVVSERSLSRWRNLGHPVNRRRYVLRSVATDANVRQFERNEETGVVIREREAFST